MRLIGGTYEEPGGQAIAQWVAERIPHVGQASDFGLYTALGVMAADDSRLLGGVIFHNYVPAYRTVEVSTASESPRWLTRAVIAGVFGYAFSTLGVERVTAVTPRRAASSRRFLEKFGFKREGAHPKAFGDYGDAISYGLLRKAWEATPYCRGRLGGKEDPTGPDAA